MARKDLLTVERYDVERVPCLGRERDCWNSEDARSLAGELFRGSRLTVEVSLRVTMPPLRWAALSLTERTSSLTDRVKVFRVSVQDCVCACRPELARAYIAKAVRKRTHEFEPFVGES